MGNRNEDTDILSRVRAKILNKEEIKESYKKISM